MLLFGVAPFSETRILLIFLSLSSQSHTIYSNIFAMKIDSIFLFQFLIYFINYLGNFCMNYMYFDYIHILFFSIYSPDSAPISFQCL